MSEPDIAELRLMLERLSSAASAAEYAATQVEGLGRTMRDRAVDLHRQRRDVARRIHDAEFHAGFYGLAAAAPVSESQQ